MPPRADLPAHETQLLEAFVRGVSWSELWSHREEPLDDERFDEVVARRIGGEPLAYITGSTGFYGREIVCGPGVLVPRPETEILVDVALAILEGVDAPTVLDIGTGTGCIALAIVTQRPDATVFATESSAAACVWAQRNLGDSTVRLIAGDLDAGCPVADLVVSNPPYVEAGAELPSDVRREPHEALFAGPRGLDVIDRLLGLAARHHAVAVEIGTPEQAAYVSSGLPDATIHNDLTGRPRVVSSPCP